MPLGRAGKDRGDAFTNGSRKPPDDLQVGATPGRANDKGLDEDCDEGPTVAAENVQTPVRDRQIPDLWGSTEHIHARGQHSDLPNTRRRYSRLLVAITSAPSSNLNTSTET